MVALRYNHLESKLGSKSDQYTKALFTAARHKDKQAFEDYSSELLILAFRALSGEDYTVEQVERQVLDHFVNTMGGNLGRELRLRIPKSLPEAVALSKNLELQGFSDRNNGVVAAVGHRGGGFARARMRG